MSDDFVRRLRADAENLPPVEVPSERVFDALARRRRRRLAALGTTPVLALVLGLAVVQPWAGEREAAVDPAEPWPGGVVASLDAFVCGERVPEVRPAGDDVTLHLEPDLFRRDGVEAANGTPLTAGSSSLLGSVLDRRSTWQVDSGIVNGSDERFEGGLGGNHPPTVWLARDGIVVGVQATEIDAVLTPPVELNLDPGDRRSNVALGPFVDCSRRAIPAGQYEVYVVQEILDRPVVLEGSDGQPWPQATMRHTLVGGPYPVTIADGTEGRDAVEAEGPGGVLPDRWAFQCGGPVPDLGPLPDNGLRLEPSVGAPWNPRAALLEGGEIPERDMEDFGQLPGATLDRTWEWSFDAGIVNRSEQTVTIGLGGNDPPTVWFVRDGRVVGGLEVIVPLMAVPPSSVTLVPGDRHSVHAGGPIVLGCGDDTEIPVPGDYEVYITVDIREEPVPGDDGWARANHDFTLVGGPYPVTITGDSYRPLYAWEWDQAQGNRPGLEDIQLRSDGLGVEDFVPLPLGAAVPVEPSDADMIVWDGEYCADAEEPGRWVSAYPEYTPGEPAFTVRVRDDRVVRIELTSMLGTDRGIGWWSRLADVQAAYPDLTLLRQAGPDWPVDSWAVTEDGNTMVFDVAPTDTGTDGETWVPGVVVGIALVEGTDYDYPTTTGLCD